MKKQFICSLVILLTLGASSCNLSYNAKNTSSLGTETQPEPQYPQVGEYKALCTQVCGPNFAVQAPEIRDGDLVCIDGNMKPIGSDLGRSTCDRFDSGPWASERGGKWCVKINEDENHHHRYHGSTCIAGWCTGPSQSPNIQCLGFVPE